MAMLDDQVADNTTINKVDFTTIEIQRCYFFISRVKQQHMEKVNKEHIYGDSELEIQFGKDR